MIEWIVAAGILLVVIIVFYIIKRITGFEFRLKERWLKALNLWTEPIGEVIDYVHDRTVEWEDTKVKIWLPFIAFSEFFILIGYGFDLLWQAISIISVFGAFLAIAYVFIITAYQQRHRQFQVIDCTVWEALNKRFRDHWPIASRDRLEIDDPLVQEARQLIDSELKKFELERIREELAQIGQGNAEEVENKLKEKYTEEQVRIMLSVIRGKQQEEAAEEEDATELLCLDCWAGNHNDDAKFCWNCGADLFPDIQYHLLTKGLCTKEDPYFQSLVITDCDFEKHENYITDTSHCGKIPVMMPITRISFTKVGEIGVGNPTQGEKTVEHSKLHIPVLMVVESKENIRRVQGRERPLISSPSKILNGENALDGLMSVKAGVVIRTQARTISSLEGSMDFVQDSAQDQASRIVGIQQYFSKPKEEEEKKGLSPTMKKILIGVLVLIVVIAALLAFFIFGLPFLQALFSGGSGAPPTNSTESLVVWRNLEVFQTSKSGSATHLFSRQHHFAEVLLQ